MSSARTRSRFLRLRRAYYQAAVQLFEGRRMPLSLVAREILLNAAGARAADAVGDFALGVAVDPYAPRPHPVFLEAEAAREDAQP
jgi:hypothetical protein